MWSAATAAAEAAGGRAPGHLYLSVYFLLGVASLGSQFSSGLFLVYGSVNAARELYEDLVTKVHLSSTTAQHARIFMRQACRK